MGKKIPSFPRILSILGKQQQSLQIIQIIYIATLSTYKSGEIITTVHGHLVYDDNGSSTTKTKSYSRNTIKVTMAHFRAFSARVPVSSVVFEDRLFMYAYFITAP